MRLSRIHIRNFRQYNDEVFEFDSAEPDVSVIVGRIGSGKTNFLNALTWCLYGREHFAGGDQEAALRKSSGALDASGKAMPMINAGSVDEDMPLGEREAAVEITLGLDDGSRATISRKQTFVVKKGNVVEALGEPRIAVMHKRDGSGYDQMDEPQHWINKHLPERMRPYFILNTERLQQFLHQSAEASRVKNAILEIAQIDVLTTMLDRLKNVRDDYYSAAGRGDPGSLLHRLEEEREGHERYIADKREERARHQGALEQHEHTVAEIMDQIGDMEEATRLITEHGEKTRELDGVVGDLDAAGESLRRQCAVDAPAVLALPAVEGFLRLADEAIDDGRWPAPVHPNYVKKLIADGKCMCGCDLDDEKRTRLESVISRNQEQVSNRALMDMSRPAAVLQAQALSFRDRIRPLQERISQLHGRGGRLRLRLAALDDQIEKLGLKDQDFLVKKERWLAANKGKDSALTSLTIVDREIDLREGQLVETMKRLKLEMAKDANKQELARMVGFTDLCIEAVECAYKELITETREEVSSALNDSFTSMIAGTKGKVFSGALVDEGYGIAVTSVQGFNAAENLSGGEDVCLALSFSQALGRVSGFALPLILDSPFIKLDPEAMVLVMRTMLENLGDRQLVLLMKTQEHDPGVERELDDAGVRSTYKLDFNEQVQSTSVAGW